jgi:diguanylate cyclase (GGDEF)-like protein/PAS domain S-box-containing protein
MVKRPADELILWTALFDQSGDGMVVLRQDGSVYRANRRYSDMLGYTQEEMEALHVWDWDARFSRDELLTMLRSVNESGAHFDSLQRRKDGALINVELSNNGAFYQGENLIFCVVRETTARLATEEKLRQSEERLQRVASQIPGALYQYRMEPDGAPTMPYFSEGLLELGGLSREELSGTDAEPAMSRILPEDVEIIEDATRESARNLSHFHAEFRILHGNGSIRWIESRSVPQREADGSILWTGVLLDITQRKQAEENVRLLATTDGLTGLTNRQEFSRLLEHEIDRAARYDTPLSLIMYDLDHFKRVNDRFGHESGDEVLRKVTALVSDNLRNNDVHGRWGGEEFMVLLPQTGLEAARDVAEKLRRTIAEHRFDRPGPITASFGVAERTAEGRSNSLTRSVDEALYRAKNNGRNRVET